MGYLGFLKYQEEAVGHVGDLANFQRQIVALLEEHIRCPIEDKAGSLHLDQMVD